MSSTVKITQIGNSMCVILSKKLLLKLQAQKGDQLYVLETPHGIELTLYDPEFAKQLDIVEDIMREDRDVLKKLAE